MFIPRHLLLCFLLLVSVSAHASEWRTVRRVIGGNTLVLDKREYVRLIGVDTPETNHPARGVERFGNEAAKFTRKLAEGKRIRLAFDKATAVIGHKDRYGRTLAYVYLEDGTLLNAEIIKQGYGFVLTRYPFALMEEFRQLETEAREQQRGLWRSR